MTTYHSSETRRRRPIRNNMEKNRTNDLINQFNVRKFDSNKKFILLVVSIVCFGLGLVLWLTAQSAQQAYNGSSERNLNQKLSNEQSLLSKMVAQNDSAPDLVRKAQKLGMIYANDVNVLTRNGTGWKVVGDQKPEQPIAQPVLPAPPKPKPAPPANPSPNPNIPNLGNPELMNNTNSLPQPNNPNNIWVAPSV